jgi:uncharacterized protein YprB with RNaseH-like and TPR domain
LKIITFDMEIAIPVEELIGGWSDARVGAAGVSCVCLHDTDTDRYHVYDEFTIEKCIDHLNSADLLVSFNGKGFDVPALEGTTGLEIFADHYDILDQVWQALGKRQKGWKLGEIAPRTIKLEKSSTGEHAPVLYRQQRFGELVDYCINDVHITKKLFDHILMVGSVIDPNGGELLIDHPDVDERDE